MNFHFVPGPTYFRVVRQTGVLPRTAKRSATHTWNLTTGPSSPPKISGLAHNRLLRIWHMHMVTYGVVMTTQLTQ